MARNITYRWRVRNDVGWMVSLWITPSNDYTDLVTNRVQSPRIVTIPAEVVDWDSFPELKTGFGDNSPRPIGMVEQASLEMTWRIDLLEEAEARGYDDAADLVDLAAYLTSPITADGCTIKTKADGSEFIELDTGNRFVVSVTGGSDPFFVGHDGATYIGGEFILFEGVQSELEEEDTVLNDLTGAWHQTVRVRHWWRVALEQIPVSALADRIINDGAGVAADGGFFYQQAYVDAGVPMVDYCNPRVTNLGGSIYAIENGRSVPWLLVWSSLEAVLSDWLLGQTRYPPGAGLVAFQSGSDFTGDGGAPTDTVTLYRRDYTAANDLGVALTRDEWRIISEFFYTNVNTGTKYETAPGGFCGEGSDWGLRSNKTLWDVVQMATEQSLAKAIPVPTSSPGTVRFRALFDSAIPTDAQNGTDVFTIYRHDLRPAGERVIGLRRGLIGETESGMNEGSGDDLETITFTRAGIEQSDGFNIPFLVHNMPKVGEAEHSKGIDWHKALGYTYGNLDIESGYRLRVYASTGYEASLWYRPASPPSGIFKAGKTPHIRPHGSPVIDIGNGVTFQDLTRTALPTSKKDELLPPLMAAAALEEQRETSWPALAAAALTGYFVTRFQYTIDADIPGHKALPHFVGSRYTIADDDGTPKGPRLWRDSANLIGYPSQAFLVESSLNLKTGRAACTFYGNHNGSE